MEAEMKAPGNNVSLPDTDATFMRNVTGNPRISSNEQISTHVTSFAIDIYRAKELDITWCGHVVATWSGT